MTNEIKVGNTVRVSKDAPRIYTQNCLNFSVYKMDFEVTNIEDGCANIKNEDGILTVAYIIPTKYLVKVGGEEKEPRPKYKVGDRMFIKYINKIGVIDIVEGYNEEEDGIFYHLKVEPKGVASAREENLTPYYEEKEPRFKVGDVVRYRYDSKLYTVECKTGKYHYALRQTDGNIMMYDALGSDLVPYTEPTEEKECIRQAEAEFDEFRKAELDKVLHPEKYTTYEVTVDNVAINWDAYTADLAKEIITYLLRQGGRIPDFDKLMQSAIRNAKSVVEELKKK